MAYEGGIVNILQKVGGNVNLQLSVTSVIPPDTSIPQISEGEELTTLSITPRSSSSTLFFEFSTTVRTTAETGTLALFEVGTADALKAQILATSTPQQTFVARMIFSISAGSTTARTYSLRVGRAAAGGLVVQPRNYGGVNNSLFTIAEYE